MLFLLPRSSRVPPGAAHTFSSTATTITTTAALIRTRFLFASIATCLIATAHAQRDPVAAFCRRFGHQTTVIDRKLYIDGGFINYAPLTSDPTNYTNTYLSYLDLDDNGSHDMPQMHANLSKDGAVPSVHGGILWGDDVNKKFYLFGGEHAQQPPADAPPPLYAFDVLRNRWELASRPPPTISGVSYGAGVAVSERGEGYYYGGWLSNTSVPGWTGPPAATTGLIRYTMDTNEWSNITGPDDGIRRAEGVMVYLPVSDSGMLVYLGGIQDPGNGSLVGQPMDEIHMYDVASSKWYTQHTSGTLPDMRRRFCAGAAWAQDQSSYNIYLYGGLGFPPNNGAGFDDVYILSLPSFAWIKMYPAPGGNNTQQYPHHSMTCNVIDGAQMLIMGGAFPLDTTTCDAPGQYGTHGLDMGEQNPGANPWFVYRKNIRSYLVPQLILKVIGGTPQGGATKTIPGDGFDEADVKILMTRRYTAAARTPTRDVPGDGGGGGDLSKNAIIGIAVGCGGAALLAAALGCCCLGVVWHRKKHRRRRKTSSSTGTTSTTNKNTSSQNIDSAILSADAAGRISGYTLAPSPMAFGPSHLIAPSPLRGPPYQTPYYYSSSAPALAPVPAPAPAPASAPAPAPAPQAPPPPSAHRVSRAPVELAGSEGMHELHDQREYGMPHLSLPTPATMLPPISTTPLLYTMPPPKYIDQDDAAFYDETTTTSSQPPMTMTTANSPPMTMTTAAYSWSRGGSPVTPADTVGGAPAAFYTISPLATTPTAEQPHQQHSNSQPLSHSWYEASSECGYGPLELNPVNEQYHHHHYHHHLYHQGPSAAALTTIMPQAAAEAEAAAAEARRSPPDPVGDREQPPARAGASKAETDGEGPRHQTYYHK